MEQIKIMISSRCKTPIKHGTGKCELSDVRIELKKVIESELIFGSKIFEVWISEDPATPDAIDNSWDECMVNALSSDMVIALYTGEGGWCKSTGDIGICHAELETVYNKEPSKLSIVNIINALDSGYKVSDTDVDKRFVKYVEQINRFASPVSSKDEIIERCKKIVIEKTVKLVKLSRRETHRGKYNSGIALDWSRMNFKKRKEVIENTIIDQLISIGKKGISNNEVIYPVKDQKIVLCCHGIPEGMGVPSARELVGQPFLRDYEIIENQDSKTKGPIHIIGVHKTITERQAISMIGISDVISVKAPFGVYIVDRIHKIQMVFLANCRDDSSTRHNVQRFEEWLVETGEDEQLSKRALSRRRIVKTILDEKE